MAGVNVTIDGAAEMLNKLQQLGANMQKAKNDAVDNAAQTFAQKMQENAQAGHPSNPERITGTLVGSIQWQHSGDGEAIAGVINDPGYALFVEYGHSQQPGRFVPALGKRLVASEVQPYPYFRPTITQVFDGGLAKQAILDSLQEAINNL